MSSSTPQKLSAGRLKELDGWRAVSVALVILHHVGAYQYPSRLGHSRLALSLFEGFGPLGVKVFFVISGFVICRLLIFEEKRFGTISLKGFYLRRVCRILPPFYVYIAIVWWLLSLGLIREFWPGLLSGACFLYDLFPAANGGWFIGHSWSLAVEEQFYVIFPTLWLLTRKLGRARLFLAIFCLIAVWNVSATLFGWDHWVIPSARAGFACICGGVVIAELETRARAVARATPVFLVIVVSVVLLWQPLPGHLNWQESLYESLFVPAAIALLLLFSLERGRLLREFLGSRPAQAIGLTSYGIYLWQELFTAPREFYAGRGRLIAHLLPLLFAIIPLSYWFIEKPAMRLGKRLTERIRQVPARAQAEA